MSVHHLAPTTHTTELRQLEEINRALSRRALPLVAKDLGLSPGTTGGGRLLRLTACGPPSYPYITGVFGRPSAREETVAVELHTAQLRAVSDRLGLRGHLWGA